MAKRKPKQKPEASGLMGHIGNGLRDERSPKIVGVAVMLFGLIAIIAFASYLVSWQADQSKVLQYGWRIMFVDRAENLGIHNWLGSWGALISHISFYWGFGLSSFVLGIIVFRIGLRLFVGSGDWRFWPFLRKMSMTLVLGSIFLAFITDGASFPYGGAFGLKVSGFLTQAIGSTGMVLLFAAAGFAMFIWYANPQKQDYQRFGQMFKFKMPSFTLFKSRTEPDLEDFADDPVTTESKSKSNGPDKIPFEGFDFSVIERDLQDNPKEESREGNNGFNVIHPSNRPLANAGVADDLSLDLEIDDLDQILQRDVKHSDTELELDEPFINTGTGFVNGMTMAPIAEGSMGFAQDNVDNLEPYDPKLELRNYKPPTLELLESYDDGKLEVDRAELEANKDQIIATLMHY
ncbi:MAG: DNA translocase FtsK 4TM domain-containing protein, partial [Saprospiraceae bacterium]